MKKVLIVHNKNIKFEDKQKLINILDKTIDKYLEELTKENRKMEEEIQDKLEKIYNNQILIEVETENKNIFKVHGSIKTYNLNIIRKGFIIYFEYDRKMTMDFNIDNLIKEIDKNIIKLHKEEK